ncbi:response regulator transcription factor [Thalassotalea sp. ND16A]|uniref:response regulator transcription factor n=1 Tax=Thalassotalea sp. ND16A TaxID=1535422 RepID=UPI00051A014D|nr:response regulator transcription factor [Thalassotalea sp. ND16A]KGJ90520.1 response regulator receiver protein [Thalassotalea sp. ND16A]
MQNNQLLLIEDDQGLARSICKFLTAKGFIVRHFVNGDNLELLIASNNFALILCDVMLPGTDGFEIAKAIRHKFNGRYIFLTALSDVEHQLKGFELGADDYICKPVDPEILLARINACLRKNTKQEPKSSIEITNLTIDNDSRIVTIENQPIALSRYEFDLLWLLALQKGQQVSREFLFVNTVGREYDGLDRTVDGRVSRLRKKLESYPNLKCQINTSWGQGYMLAAKD